MDGDGPGLALHLLTLPGQVAEFLSIHLQRRIHRRDLHNFSAEPAQNRFQLFPGHIHRLLGQHSTRHILRVGGDAQPQDRFISFFRVLKKLHAPGGSSHKHRQHTGSHGVQSTAMTNASGLEHPPQPGCYILARPLLGLVYNYNSVHSIPFCGAAATSPTGGGKVGGILFTPALLLPQLSPLR